MNWYLAVLKKYLEFGGRASRTEFWMFALFNFIVSMVLAVIDNVIGTKTAQGIGILGAIYGLGVLLPYLGVGARRLHDTGRSGWWLLLLLIPFIGWVVLLIFYVLESQAGENQYGPSPHPATP
jgi:uncharacterized membrane protein YhaH (DUF805 family)